MKKWKKSEVKKWRTFWSLNFFVFRYVEGGVLGNNYISIKKCRTTFLWEWYFGEVGEIFKNFQNHPLGEGFWKNGLQLHFFEINLQVISLEKKNKVEIPYVLKKNLQVISLEKNNSVGFFFLVRNFFKGISHIKLKVSSIFGLNFLKKVTSDFPRKINLCGNSLCFV